MKVSVLGYGTVGAGVFAMLSDAEGLEPGSVLVRPGKTVEPFHVTDIEDIVSDGSVGAVVEAMGGTIDIQTEKQVRVTGQQIQGLILQPVQPTDQLQRSMPQMI